MIVSDTACAPWQRRPRPRKECRRLHQRLRISMRLPRQGLDDPGVAALLFGFLKLPPRPPGYGMPPVQTERQKLQAPNPVVATAQVRQLVDQQGVALGRLQTLPERSRQKDSG